MRTNPDRLCSAKQHHPKEQARLWFTLSHAISSRRGSCDARYMYINIEYPSLGFQMAAFFLRSMPIVSPSAFDQHQESPVRTSCSPGPTTTFPFTGSRSAKRSRSAGEISDQPRKVRWLLGSTFRSELPTDVERRRCAADEPVLLLSSQSSTGIVFVSILWRFVSVLCCAVLTMRLQGHQNSSPTPKKRRLLPSPSTSGSARYEVGKGMAATRPTANRLCSPISLFLSLSPQSLPSSPVFVQETTPHTANHGVTSTKIPRIVLPDARESDQAAKHSHIHEINRGETLDLSLRRPTPLLHQEAPAASRTIWTWRIPSITGHAPNSGLETLPP